MLAVNIRIHQNELTSDADLLEINAPAHCSYLQGCLSILTQQFMSSHSVKQRFIILNANRAVSANSCSSAENTDSSHATG